MSIADAMEAKGGVQSIARAASILRALKGERDGLSLGRIAQRVGLPRSTVQRLVGALEAERFVVAASPEGGMRLGPEIEALAEAARIDIVHLARPHVVDLSRRTGETVDLSTPRGDGLLFLDQAPGAHRLRAVSSVGDTFPLTTTANGKACLALMPASAARAALAREGGARSVAGFLAELRRVRASGVAYDEDEHTEGISAVGAAFRDVRGAIYALSVPAPSARFAQNRVNLTIAIKATREAIAAVLAPALENA